MTRSRPVTEKDSWAGGAVKPAHQMSPCDHADAWIQSKPDLSLLADHLGLDKSQRPLVAVRREDCTPRLGRRARPWLEMTDDDAFETDSARLVSALRP
jgi:hypothetical protein